MTATLDAPALADRLRAERVIPVLRTRDADGLRAQLDRCLEAGLGTVEITTTSPGWRETLARVAADPAFADILVGAGTVTTAEQARHAVDAGARFLVSPYLAPQARSTAVAAGVVLVEGGFTPGEIAAAGATTGIAKLFPAASAGIGQLRAIGDVLPELRIMPTGGITIDTAADWIGAGAIAVGMGGGLLTLETARIRDLVDALRAIA